MLHGTVRVGWELVWEGSGEVGWWGIDAWLWVAELTVVRKPGQVQGLQSAWMVRLLTSSLVGLGGESGAGGGEREPDPDGVLKQSSRDKSGNCPPGKGTVLDEQKWKALKHHLNSGLCIPFLPISERALGCFWKGRRNSLKCVLFFPINYAFLKAKAS